MHSENCSRILLLLCKYAFEAIWSNFSENLPIMATLE